MGGESGRWWNMTIGGWINSDGSIKKNIFSWLVILLFVCPGLMIIIQPPIVEAFEPDPGIVSAQAPYENIEGLASELESEISPEIPESSLSSGYFDKSRIKEAVNNLDGYFTKNNGQVGVDDVKYYIQGKGIWFLEDAVVFQIFEDVNTIDDFELEYKKPLIETQPELQTPLIQKSAVVKLNFEGASTAGLEGMGLLNHQSNFFFGNDSSKWCTNVPNYQEIIYRNLYDNIDLRYYSTPSGLKYDFIVHPEGNLENIMVRVEGASALEIPSFYDLRIRTPVGDLVDSGLLIYQDTGCSVSYIDGQFKQLSSNTYGFELTGDYDRSRDLIIDPLVHSTFIAGNKRDTTLDIALDSSVNAYVSGYTLSSDFPTTPGAYDTTHYNLCSFILKFNPTNLELKYSTFVGSGSYDRPYGIAVDDFGNAYVAGTTQSSGFPTTKNAFDTSFSGYSDVFLFKLNHNGSALNYSTFIGGNYYDEAYDIVVDRNCLEYNVSAYITGYTSSKNWPNSAVVFDPTHNGGADVFVFKMNPTGRLPMYSTFIGAGSSDYGYGIELDTFRNVYVAGYTSSSLFPTTSIANDTTYNGGTDAFALKLNPSGTALVYSTFIGAEGADICYDMELDNTNNVYIAGETNSVNFTVTPGANDTTINGKYDAYVLKLDQTGSTIVYATFIGGSGHDFFHGIGIDKNRNAYVTGLTLSNNFPIEEN
ncbi:MAG: SBBP repeat-containing protein [Thermoplasmata archaeon]|nr:MAG: SBBP repeat-containing protein [Thermoplasmata archaeon]